MATRSTPPAEPGEAAPQDAPADETAQSLLGEYLDETARTYLWPDGPQTVERGDVVAVPADWEHDGRFARSSRKSPTRLRDNHPDERAKTAERQTKARNDLHARLAKEGE